MFRSGEFYMERVTTGKLTFDTDGIPSASPMLHGQVFNFSGQEVVKRLQDNLTPISADEIKPNTGYMRLFHAPEPSFDDLGELKQPRFSTVGFFELGDNLSNIVTGYLISSVIQPFATRLPAACRYGRQHTVAWEIWSACQSAG